MLTKEQKLQGQLQKVRADVAALRKRLKSAHRLMSSALDSITDYTDGRNDRVCNALAKWLNGNNNESDT